MKVSDFEAEGNTLKAESLPAGKTLRLTIRGFDSQVFVNEDESKDEKCVILFEGKTKGIATGVMNLHEIERVYGDDMDSWIGKELDVSTAMKSNKKIGFVLNGVADGAAEGVDDIPF